MKVVGKCMLEDRKMQDAASMAIFVLNRTPNRYEGEWQREALFQMFKISTDYSRFRIMLSKAFVHKRPHEYRKDWRPGGYKGFFVGFDEVSYSVWVPELGEQQSQSTRWTPRR